MNRVKTTLYSVVTWTLSWVSTNTMQHSSSCHACLFCASQFVTHCWSQGILSVLGFLAGFWIGWKLL